MGHPPVNQRQYYPIPGHCIERVLDIQTDCCVEPTIPRRSVRDLQELPSRHRGGNDVSAQKSAHFLRTDNPMSPFFKFSKKPRPVKKCLG